MNDYQIGSFGLAKFKYEKKAFNGGIEAHGFIKDMDGKYVLFVDCDEFPFLVRKDKFTFEVKEKPIV